MLLKVLADVVKDWKKEMAKEVLRSALESFFTSAASHVADRIFQKGDPDESKEDDSTTVAEGDKCED